jgi:hypothetical protein
VLADIPSFSKAARIMISPTPLSAFTATVFPARSRGVRTELEPLTRMFCQLSAADVPSTSLDASSCSGMPPVDPIANGRRHRRYRCYSYREDDVAAALKVCLLNVIPCSEESSDSEFQRARDWQREQPEPVVARGALDAVPPRRRGNRPGERGILRPDAPVPHCFTMFFLRRSCHSGSSAGLMSCAHQPVDVRGGA